ncbi:hypothetical protein V5T82_03290 [Magnetovibrio sp. PR-2]|uniref:hypothetical protein n=1 Tax=Magnetovibrio sp. PR-2 TaxID=3120356 RepID=UPI002FCE5AD1
MAHKPRMVIYFNNNTLPLSSLKDTKYTDVVLAFALPENTTSTKLKITGNLPQGDQLAALAMTLRVLQPFNFC